MIESTSDFLDKTKFFNASNYVKGWIGQDSNIEIISRTLSPVYFLNEKTPDILTIHGTKDRWVPYNQAVLLDEKLGEKHQLLCFLI